MHRHHLHHAIVLADAALSVCLLLDLRTGVSYAITVSALAGPNPPTFDEVVVQANNNPALFDATGRKRCALLRSGLHSA
jgi:hypothetical protein